MVRRLGATEAKATFLRLLNDVAAGEEVEITKRGKTVARLVPPRAARGLRGAASGIAKSAARDDELFSAGVEWELR
ncbi:MAG TPA: type II toxin-antitoxin system prevent-host-death family antitoxin [Actinomycetota bacterium]|nr:type II toxin-antitoxin system prevent-host-death family antitoxin [Actinomycetota bacterium]